MTGLIDFSIFATENGTGAPPILWPEGMPAKSVNDSGRELMAALARWRADNNGGLGATMVGNTANLASLQGIKESHFAGGFSMSFATSQANTGPMTLNIDGTGARPWRRPRGIEFGPGDIVPLMIHTVVWSPAQDSYISLSPSFETPGKISAFATPEAIPPGWVECDGRAISRAAYAALLSVIGFTFGAGVNGATFNVPDLNGRTLFGRDGGKGRLTTAGGIGGNPGDVGGSETVALSEAQMPAHSHTGGTSNAGGHDHGGTNPAGQHSHGGSTGGAGAHNHNGTTGGAGSHSHGGSTTLSGNHSHDVSYTKLAIYGGGGGLTAVSEMFPPNPGNSTAVSSAAGEHQHNIATDSVGDHTHNFTTSGVGDHAHTINADGNHTHSIPAVGDHNHSLSISSTGGGQAHPNMPPGLVGVFAIKG